MKITVIGMGHLGVVAAGGLAREGHHVTGLDTDGPKVEALKKGKSAIYEPGLDAWLAEGMRNGRLRFLHLEEFADALGEAAVIATGTPAGEGEAADLCQVVSALRWVRSRRPGNTAIVMKSTVPPGSGKVFAQRELKGLEVAYVSNPEFLREGKALHDWMYPDRIVVGTEGCSRTAAEIVRRMYPGIDSPYLVTDTASAEMLKYASNAFLAMRISFINEIAGLCEEVGASIDAVSRGLAMDARTGQQIHAGIGYGGSCFPKDILALLHLAQARGLQLDLLSSVASVNARQRLLPIARLRSRFAGSLAGLRIGVLGLAFKPGTSDLREAPSLDLIEALVAGGAEVKAFDPQANNVARGVLPSSVALVDSIEAAARGVQALLLLTEWTEIVDADWAEIAAHMRPPKFLLDGRNALDAEHMIGLGFDYMGVGRGQLQHLWDESEIHSDLPANILPIS